MTASNNPEIDKLALEYRKKITTTALDTNVKFLKEEFEIIINKDSLFLIKDTFNYNTDFSELEKSDLIIEHNHYNAIALRR